MRQSIHTTGPDMAGLGSLDLVWILRKLELAEGRDYNVTTASRVSMGRGPRCAGAGGFPCHAVTALGIAVRDIVSH